MNIREPRDFEGVRSQRRTRHTLHKVRKILLALVVTVLSVVLLGYVSYARALPLITAQVTLPAVTTEAVAINWPAQGQAALGVQGQGVLATTDGQRPLPTASTAKVMVALMVLEKYPLTPGQPGATFTITPADVAEYNAYIARGGSALRVEAGQQLTQYQALQALLIPSANNIADLLAVWAYGSLPAYFEAANQKAQQLGMTQSRFAGDASGLSPQTVSTAHDLVLLGQAALQAPIIKEIIGQKSATFPVVGTVTNTNLLLGREGIVGIKTGNTDEAGGCYMFAADHTLPNGRVVTAIGAIMAAPSLPQAFGYTLPLLNSFYKGFGVMPVASADETVARYVVPWGGTVTAQTAGALSVVGWRNTKPVVTVGVEPLRAPVAQAATVGALKVQTVYDEASVPIVLSHAIIEPTWLWRVWRR